MNRSRPSGMWRLAIPALFVATALIVPNSAWGHLCWYYSSQPATNPQPWEIVGLGGSSACTTTNSLHASGSTAGQTIGEQHRNFHCVNPAASTEAYGRAFLAFHRQFILDFDNYRLTSTSFGRLEIWDPFQGAPVPGNNENTVVGFTNCSTASCTSQPCYCTQPDDVTNACTTNADCAAGYTCNDARPAGVICTNCVNLPDAFIGNNLNNFSSLGELGWNLELGTGFWHGTYHTGVGGLGCRDINGFLYTPRDPAFWMAHKKLDEISRDWQALQATDVVIVIDRSGSMDNNCSSMTPPLNESPCAINDAREAARTFANFALDVRLDGGVPAARQHRIGLVSFSNSATSELSLTSVDGIVSGGSTGFETALDGITTGGLTSIASGIREAIAILNGVADPNSHQAILVLTDGRENVAPCLGGNSPSDCSSSDQLTASELGEIQIVAVGYGPGAEEANLRDVAERHGGIFVAEENVDDPLSLQKFFVTAFGEIFDAGISVDPRGTFAAGQVRSEPFEIEICDDERLSVVLGYERIPQGGEFAEGAECELEIQLTTPNGTLVDRTDAGVEAGHAGRHDFIHVNLPYRDESKGTWTARIVRPANSSKNCRDQDYFYSVLTKSPTGRVDPFVVRPNIVVGRRILATFRITESNRPIGGFDRVTARVTLTRPDGSTQTATLFDDGTNGDSLVGNNVWSHEFSAPATQPGVFHLRGQFELTKNGCTRVREAEYSIVAIQEPDQCTKVSAGGIVNNYVAHRIRPGEIIRVEELACVSNLCPDADEYQVEIVDVMNWLKTTDPLTGAVIDLPSAFSLGRAAPFSMQCIGGNVDPNDGTGNIPLVVVVPADAQVGDESMVSIRFTSLVNGLEIPIDVETMIQVAPPPDCNENGIDDAIDIADGTAEDEDRNGIPDLCEGESHFPLPEPDDDGRIDCGSCGSMSLIPFLLILGLFAVLRIRLIRRQR